MQHKLPKWGTRNWIDFVKRNDLAFNSISPSEFTKDGLMSCSKLIVGPSESSFSLWLKGNDEISVAANNYVNSVTEYLVRNSQLWNLASIRIASGKSIQGRAPMYGVPFKKAVELAIAEGFVKSMYYIPDQQDNISYANILLHLNKRKPSNGGLLQLQAWQYSPGISEVFYIHAESENFTEYVTHLDGAIIHFQPNDIRDIFKYGNKIKGDQYSKQFRLDGNIPIKDMFNIISLYLPVSELVSEAFEYSECNGTT